MKKKKILALNIFLVLVLSIAISAAVMIAANDVFALKKDGEETLFVLENDMSIKDASEKLKDEGFISFPSLFRLYFSLKSKKDVFPAGEYTLSKSMSYDEIRYEIYGIGKPRKEIRITIPEGYTTDEIIELFVSNGIGTRENFCDVIQNYDFGYDFISLIPENEDRKYRLDGYLFPDTYMFFSDSSERAAIDKLLSNFERNMSGELIEDAKKRGFSIDEIITLASIIQKEAYHMSDMAVMSSVFFNRLKNNMYLQSDATGLYGESYDTYKNGGLPSGPISNPGYAAISAAIYPANTKYYYFVTGNDKKAVFSKTFAEHKRAVARIASAKNDN